MRIERFRVDGDPAAVVAEIRAMAPTAESVADAVAEIVADVAERGDAAVADATRRFDTGGAEPPPLVVPPAELETALNALDPEVRAAIQLAVDNVRAVAAVEVDDDREVTLPAGHRVVVREVPVRRAGVYVPGGRAPYPSTVAMGVGAARAAGVESVAVCAPPGRDGAVHPTILAACALCGADVVYRMGGAQAIAALAYGTESVAAVDVIVGPGNLYVQEAKHQVSERVGLDGFAGPSDLLVLLSPGADPRLAALDMLAQGEHGRGSLVVAVGTRSELDEVAATVEALGLDRPSAADAGYALVEVPDVRTGLTVAEAFAPEHLELAGEAAEALAGEVRNAGAVFVGRAGATAFGDYVAGSNHVLPTAGAARFASGLSPRHFRRRMTEVHLADAVDELAGPGAALARAEGFEVHAESMEARMQDNAEP
jgi:histidinol dehydrogenase